MDLDFSISFNPLQINGIDNFGKMNLVWVSKYHSQTLDKIEGKSAYKQDKNLGRQ